jgi:cytochrome c oxidase assembly protein Cox11
MYVSLELQVTLCLSFQSQNFSGFQHHFVLIKLPVTLYIAAQIKTKTGCHEMNEIKMSFKTFLAEEEEGI